MNWIILIIAGLCETGFAFCLGKTKLAVGTDFWLWISGFALLYVLSAVLLKIQQLWPKPTRVSAFILHRLLLIVCVTGITPYLKAHRRAAMYCRLGLVRCSW